MAFDFNFPRSDVLVVTIPSGWSPQEMADFQKEYMQKYQAFKAPFIVIWDVSRATNNIPKMYSLGRVLRIFPKSDLQKGVYSVGENAFIRMVGENEAKRRGNLHLRKSFKNVIDAVEVATATLDKATVA